MPGRRAVAAVAIVGAAACSGGAVAATHAMHHPAAPRPMVKHDARPLVVHHCHHPNPDAAVDASL